MMRKTLCLLVLAAAVICGCHGEDASISRAVPLTGTLRIVGASTMAPLVAELAALFHAAHPGVSIDLQKETSGRAIESTRAGIADIGMVARALTENERDLLAFSIARDGVSLVVHSANPARGLTTEQAIGILTGRIANWSVIAGPDAPIAVVTRTEGRAGLDVVTQYFRIGAGEIHAAATASDNQSALKAVVADRGAITITSVGVAERAAADGAPIKVLELDGIEATSRNLRVGKYPLSRSLTLITRSLPEGIAKAFIEFALSPEVAPAIRRSGFVSYVD